MVWWAELSHGSLHMTTYRYPSLFATILLFAGCDASDGERPQPQPTFGEGLAAIEEPYQAVYYETPIELRGVVTGPDGAPLAGATVSAQGLTTTTLPDGTFTLSGLTRRTSFATFEAEGHRQESVAVWLHQPLAEDTLDVGTVSLAADTEDVARFLFTGDVSLGRRFLSSEPPIDRVPPDDPDALITVSDAARTTGPILAGMRPYLQAADFASINLETVVTDEPDTPFEQKPYVFFTLPGSLDALTAAGVDYAALANNHMYDYLEKGVVDTLEHLTARDLPHSGAGATPDAAFAPYRTTVRGADYSMISVCSIDGSQYPILFVADEEKGGAAYAWDSDRFSAVLAAERAAGRVPVVNIHTGSEYTELPVESSHGRMLFAAEAGAALVIAHHPHVPQGLQWHGGSLIAHSLGNFIFDQERLETVLGLLVRVDMRGDAVAGARAIPVYLENFVPRAIAGPLADVFLRRIAQAVADGAGPRVACRIRPVGRR